MVKIFQLDFTQSGVAYVDTVSGVTGTLPSDVLRVNPLPGFSIRPGKYIYSTSYIVLPTVAGDSHRCHIYDNLRFYKSFNMWIHTTGIVQNNGVVFGEQQSSAGNLSGWYGTSNGRLTFNINTSSIGTVTPSGVMSTARWHMLTATINKTNNTTKVYYNGQLQLTYSGNVPTTVPGNSTFSKDRYGNEYFYNTGLFSIYDHILSQEEITNLYNTFLPDALVQAPVASLSGTVVGINEFPISGATVGVFSHASNQLESIITTTGDGRYLAYFSTVGNYTLFSTKPTITGGRAIPITVVSGGGINFYDS